MTSTILLDKKSYPSHLTKTYFKLDRLSQVPFYKPMTYWMYHNLIKESLASCRVSQSLS